MQIKTSVVNEGLRGSQIGERENLIHKLSSYRAIELKLKVI